MVSFSAQNLLSLTPGANHGAHAASGAVWCAETFTKGRQSNFARTILLGVHALQSAFGVRVE